MSIQEVNYDIMQGDTWQITIPATDIFGNTITNFSNYSFTVQVRDKEGGNTLCATASLGHGITTGSGTITINLSPTQTAAFNIPKSVYQIQLTDPSSNKKTLQTGWFQVHPSVIK